jgi:curved DNA-binding protein CbpA
LVSEARPRTPKPVARPQNVGSTPLPPKDAWLLSCIDGSLTDVDLVVMTGLGEKELDEGLARLEAMGLITLQATIPPPRVRAAATRMQSEWRGISPSVAPAAPVPTPAPSGTVSSARAAADEEMALAEDVDLDVRQKRELLDLFLNLERLDHYALLGVDSRADKKTVKRAYFERAAKFHPDRYFRKRLGSFKVRMEAIFSRMTVAHDALANDSGRAEYDAYLSDQRRLRGMERLLSVAPAEARRVREDVEAHALTQERWSPSPVPDAAPRPGQTPSPSNAPSVSMALRRDALARRLLGGRNPTVPPPASSSIPAPSMSSADAMDALRRRYEERVLNAKSSEAKKYVSKAEQALAENNVAAAANAFQVAVTLAPNDEILKQRAREAQAKADLLLGEAYVRQAKYEERNEQWTDAMRSWSSACRVLPNDADAHEHAAMTLTKGDGDLHEALRLAQRACTLDPQNPRRRVTLANTYLAAGLHLNARRELETAVTLAPQDDSIGEMLRKVAKLS